ncbi:MAG: alpha/beta hydrolase [Candidatus Neomarinimicrobiota bacterium]
MSSSLTASDLRTAAPALDLTEYCAPGCHILEEMLAISDRVSLRVITFTPPVKTTNPPVLFIPGWISRLDSWVHALREMTRDHKVYYVDSREKVTSVVSGRVEYGVAAIARDIVRLVDRFGLTADNYLLFGSSLGATAILESCRDLNQRPLALILVGPNAVFHSPWWGGLLIRIFPPRLYLIMKPFLKWYLRNFRVDAQADPVQYQKYCANLDDADPYKLKQAARELIKYEIWDTLPGVTLPVLIFGAESDKLHDPGNIAKMIPLLSRCSYIDMGTNTRTHSGDMVVEMRKFLADLAA